MGINWNRYKTYDDSEGRGNAKEWRNTFHKRMTGEEVEEIISTYKAHETVYTILGVTTSATPEEIKKAYRKKVMEWHPDKNPHRQEEATEMFKKIQAAYERLT